jgi:hypothetical protein
VTAATFLGLAGAATALVVSGAPDRPPGPRALASADGSLALSDSRGGGAILDAAGIAPGHAVEGTLTIRNAGGGAGTLGLSSTRVEASGAGGRELLGALRLRIDDVTGGTSVPVHDGTLGDVDVDALATLAPGADRTYRFVARLPAEGARDNRLQGASVQLAYAWTLTGRDEVVGPEEPPPTVPTVPTPPRIVQQDPILVPTPRDRTVRPDPSAALPTVPQPAPGPEGVPEPPAPPVARTTTRGTVLDAAGRFAVRVSCARGPRSCRVRVRVRRGRTTVGARTVTVRAGRSLVLRARPTAAMLRSLRRGRPVVVYVTVRAGGGRGSSTTRVVVRPRPR